MSTPSAGRQFWRGVLETGTATTIPRWTLDPAPGVGEVEVTLPEDLTRALRALAVELGIPVSTVLLAAHSRVLAGLAGEPDVVTGYVAVPGGRPLPCPVSTGSDTWRSLLLDARRVEATLLAHHGFPVDDLAAELGLTAPSFETECDPTGHGDEPGSDTVLRVELVQRDDRLVVRVRHRTEAIDSACAARILGYHVSAFGLMASDPGGRHRCSSLLSEAEQRFQLDGLAGPRRAVPDRRFHELVEDQAARRPDEIATVLGDEHLTYGQLNVRANRLARALLSRGLRREGVVAVMTERNLSWVVAVLAIAKAGGVYLPVEPQLPAARVAAMLTRTECRLVLTEAGSHGALDDAVTSVPGVETIEIAAALAERHAEENLDLAVPADQLAYIYFTSGSTGEPKGAMCEHAGLLNHLFAKIDDLRIGEGQVVAQTAPAGFDISLWQLFAALLVGGRTLLVDQETILDVRRFVDTVVDRRVSVLQVVPSYLEVVLTHLERHPRELPNLHCVSVTGEALSMELTRRWFAAQPGIPLVNAYGLTETSDDTNHEVLDRVPEHGLVPLGRPVNNVRAYVVDDDLAPVPLGAPGELVFSGVCVGRGYVNDPHRTGAAFLADPHHPGERLYRSGDRGRWLPDGKLAFLGRRDTQVKIRGFRIEIGEVEATLARVPGVGTGAVVVVDRAGRGSNLAAFYTGPQPVEVEVLRDGLGATLTDYMVPSSYHWLERLPLTANGKVDRAALTALADELGSITERRDLMTPTERRMAAAWATVLGVPLAGIGRQDHFFDSGGTSLAAVELVVALGRALSLRDIIRNPVLADLAALVDNRSTEGSSLEPTAAERTQS